MWHKNVQNLFLQIHVIICIRLCFIKDSNCESEETSKWISYPKENRVSEGLQDAITIWTTSVDLENILKEKLGKPEYEEAIKTEVEGEKVLQELKVTLRQLTTAVESIKQAGGLSPVNFMIQNSDVVILINRFLEHGKKDFDSTVEKGKTFFRKAVAVEESILTNGVLLMEKFREFGKFYPKFPEVNEVLSQIPLNLDNPSVESEQKDFKLQWLETLKDLFLKIDDLEGKTDEYLQNIKSNGEGNFKKLEVSDSGDYENVKKIVDLAMRQREDILEKQIKPIIAKNVENLGAFYSLVSDRFKRIKKMSYGMDRSFEDLIKTLRRIKEEIGKVDMELLARSNELNEFTTEASDKGFLEASKEFFRNLTLHMNKAREAKDEL